MQGYTLNHLLLFSNQPIFNITAQIKTLYFTYLSVLQFHF